MRGSYQRKIKNNVNKNQKPRFLIFIVRLNPHAKGFTRSVIFCV